MNARAREQGRPRHAPAWTLVMSVAASSLSFIDGSILNVALPAIRESTGANAAEVQWVVNGYTLPLAALILLGGALGDHHGRRQLDPAQDDGEGSSHPGHDRTTGRPSGGVGNIVGASEIHRSHTMRAGLKTGPSMQERTKCGARPGSRVRTTQL